MKYLKTILEILMWLFGGKKSPLAELKETIRREVEELDNDYDKMLEKQKTADSGTFKSLHYKLSFNRAERTKKLAQLGAAVLYPGRNDD